MKTVIPTEPASKTLKDRSKRIKVMELAAKLKFIKERVKDGKKVRFTRYRQGNLYYETEDGFEFPVPLSDAGDATFLVEDKAILFMRYIRKALDALDEIDVVLDRAIETLKEDMP